MKNLEMKTEQTFPDKRIRKTKSAFRKALCALLKEKELSQITVKELCAKADVNRGTFYAHYNTIEDILVEIEDEMVAFIRAQFDMSDPQKSPKELVMEHLSSGISYITQHPDLCQMLMKQRPKEQFSGRVSQAVSEYLARDLSGIIDSPVADNTFSFLYGGCIGVLHQWINSGMTTPAEEITKTITDMLQISMDAFSEFLKL